MRVLRRSEKPRPARRRVIVGAGAAVVYVIGAGLWAHLIAAHRDDYGGSPGRWWLVVGALVLGAVVGRWPVILFPALLPLTAIGAGRGTNPDSDIPIWFELLLIVAPVAVVAAALGVIASRLLRRATGSPSLQHLGR